MKKREISLSEYGVEEYYPPRVRWHVNKTLEGLYGMVLKDMRSLPLAESGEIQQLEETYKYLTYYYKEGMDDPKRSEILRGIGTSLMQLLRANAAHIEEEERPNDTRCETVQRLKIYQLNAEKIVHLIDELSEEVSKREQSFFDKVDQLFDYLWATPRLPKSVCERLQYALEMTQLPALVAQSIVSALFVGSMEYFDEQKISLLLAFAKGHHDPIVRGAAMAALLVLGRRHQAELSTLHPDLVAEVETFLLSREELLLELLKVVQISYKTTENHKTYEEKIVPELKNISDKFRQSMGGTGSLSSQIAELQKKAIDKEHFEEMEELMAKVPDQLKMLQDAEQDTAYHLVTGLKGFAFFSKMSHWFLRFDEQYSDLDQANVEVFTRILPFMSQGRRMISADMYSYALVPAWREVVRGMEADILEQSMPDATPLPAPTEVDGARELLFSAYRFYQLSSHRHTLVSPFARSPYLLDGAFLSRRGLLSEEGLLKLATMMVGFGQYDAAGRTYERVVADYLTNTAEVWRGMSVASIMRNDHEGALQQLQKAVELEGPTALVAQSIVSALFVGSMEYFDEQKISLLLAFAKGHHDPIVRGAAMAALLVLGRRHQAELSTLHPDLVAEVETFLLSREELLLELLKVVQISYKTTENHKTYEEKIVPELKNISDKFRQSMGGTGSLSSQIAELQKKAIDKEHFEEMEELMAKVPDQLKMLQDAEQDTAYHLVTGLKGFAFFSKMSHWFLRFDEQYSDLDQANVEVFTRILPFMSQGRRMISADMYSYALVPAWREVVRGMEADILEQSMPDATPLPAPTEVDGARELLFSAYRFYQLSSHRHTLVSPFARSPYLLDGAFLSRRGLLSEEGLLKLATMMVGFGQYDAAGRTYERVVADYLTNTAEVWRGMSVASIMRNDHEGALQQLQKAVELEGPTAITASKIAELLIKLGRRGEAIKWLETSEEQVESYRLPLLRAELLYQSGRNEEAMKAAYKAHYLSDGKNAKSLSIIVELLLLSGKAQEAKELLERATNSGEGTLLFWRALSTLAEGQRKEGIEQLSQWAKDGSPDLTLLAKLQLLTPYGYSTSDQSLIKDIIYSKE